MRNKFAILSLAVLSVTSLLPVTAAAADQVPPLSVSPNIIGTKTLEVCNGRTVSSTGIWTSFPCTKWEINIRHGQIYPADELSPAAAVYSGTVINNCGSGSAAILDIQATTPALARLFARLDICDGSTPPGSNVIQLFVEAECYLFVGDGIHMNGEIGSTLYDNRSLTGDPIPLEMSHGDCRLAPKTSGAG